MYKAIVGARRRGGPFRLPGRKSANPLSPAVAGPVEGVVISTPNLLEPGQDWSCRSRDQPMKLMFQNADTQRRPPAEVLVRHRNRLPPSRTSSSPVRVSKPSADGVTQFQLPDKLAAGTYWWRTRAEDGANTGPYSRPKSFQVLAEVVLAPPMPSSPSNGSTVSDLTPEFKIKAGNRSGVTADIEYIAAGGEQLVVHVDRGDLHRKDETWPETTIDRNYSFLTAGPITGVSARATRPRL